MRTTPRKIRKFSASRAAFLVVALLTARSAFAEDGGAAASYIYISPEFDAGTFVTVKGDGSTDATRDLHTGDYNLLFIPTIVTGYRNAPWSIGARASAPFHFLDLDLPGDTSAGGLLQTTEFGFQGEYAFLENARRALSATIAASVALGGAADIDLRDADGDKVEGRTYEPDRKMRNTRLLAGVAYDIKTSPEFAVGFFGRLMYASHDLVTRGDVATGATGEDRLELSVYSFLVGARCRFSLPL